MTVTQTTCKELNSFETVSEKSSCAAPFCVGDVTLWQPSCQDARLSYCDTWTCSDSTNCAPLCFQGEKGELGPPGPPGEVSMICSAEYSSVIKWWLCLLLVGLRMFAVSWCVAHETDELQHHLPTEPAADGQSPLSICVHVFFIRWFLITDSSKAGVVTVGPPDPQEAPEKKVQQTRVWMIENTEKVKLYMILNVCTQFGPKTQKWKELDYFNLKIFSGRLWPVGTGV